MHVSGPRSEKLDHARSPDAATPPRELGEGARASTRSGGFQNSGACGDAREANAERGCSSRRARCADALDECRFFDARDHFEPPAATPAPVDLDRGTRFNLCIHPIAHVLFERPHGAGFSAASALPRPAGVIAARGAPCGANTPW